MDGGDGLRNSVNVLNALNCHLKMVRMAKFCCVYFTTIKNLFVSGLHTCSFILNGETYYSAPLAMHS